MEFNNESGRRTFGDGQWHSVEIRREIQQVKRQKNSFCNLLQATGDRHKTLVAGYRILLMMLVIIKK